MKKITIAIDGFSSCGKSTMAKDLAREVGYIYIDSGAMYRAVTLYSIENGIFNGDVIDTEKLKEAIRDIRITFRPNPETGRPDTYLNGVNVENKIRTMGVSSKVSPISALDFYPLFLYYFSELFRQPFLLLFDAQIRIVEQQSVICFAQWTHFTILVDVIPLLYVLKNFFEAAFLAFCF